MIFRMVNIIKFLVAVFGISLSLNSMAKTVTCFSNMIYESLENDYIGLTICLLEHRGGVSLIFQEGDGPLEMPVLAEAKVNKNHLIFKLPHFESQFEAWQAVLLKKEMIVTNPIGNIFRLKQVSSF